MVRGAVLGEAGTTSGLGAEGFGGQIQGPEHHQGGVRVDALGSENAVDLDLVPAKVARGLGDAEAENEGAATGTGHVVEARLDVEVMATADAAADGGLLTAASVGEDVAANTYDRGTRVHSDLRGAKVQGRFQREGTRKQKSGATLRRYPKLPEMGNNAERTAREVPIGSRVYHRDGESHSPRVGKSPTYPKTGDMWATG